MKKLLLTLTFLLALLKTNAQTPLTLEEADLRYKPKSYVPYLFAINIAGTPYFIVDSVYNVETPVYTWNMVQDKPDFKSVAFDARYDQILGTPIIPSLTGYGMHENNNEYSVDSLIFMDIPKATREINKMMDTIRTKLPMSKTITINGSTKTFSSNPSFTITEVDGSVTNELQTLSGTGTKTLTLSNSGGTYVLPNVSSVDISSALGGSPLLTEVDGSTTNEIQTLSLVGNLITLSNSGGSITIPTQTTALTASQVTAAIGYTPLSNTYTPIDNSITNEIELPSQTGQSGKYLTTNGSTPSWNTIPSAITQTLVGSNGITITSGVNTYTVSKTKRQETYTGTTNSSGIVTFSFSAFPSVPNIIYSTGFGTTNKETCIPNSAYTTTGCSFKVELRSDVLGLLPTYSNVNGREVSITVTEN